MRNAGRLRLGYFPLPLKEAQRIRACLHYASSCSVIDPCIGDGAAFLEITSDARARQYGTELDAYRAEQAAAIVDEVIQGSCLDVHCPVESVGLLFLNSPYDWPSAKAVTNVRNVCSWPIRTAGCNPRVFSSLSFLQSTSGNAATSWLRTLRTLESIV